jgi:hypothetical protein
MPQLVATGLLAHMQWFMQNGASLHTRRIIMDFPHDTSGPHVISDWYPNHHACEQIWRPNMDINPCNIFIWDFKYCCAVAATKHVSHNMTLQYNLIPNNSAKVLRAMAIQLQVRVYITQVLPNDHTHTTFIF